MHSYFSPRPGRILLLTSLALACLACGKTGMKAANVDGGVKDASSPADDGRATKTDAILGDLSALPDLTQTGPDVLGQPDSPARDLAGSKDAVWDGASDVRELSADAVPGTDAASSPDGSRDAKFAPEIPAIPSGVVIYTTDKLPGADAKCVAGVDGWLAVVATYLPEAQKCWEDSDCIRSAFGSLCGTVCVLPVNENRIEEMDTHSGEFGWENCDTCPSYTGLPSCEPPGEVLYCNAGRCDYR
jgi:hypothetical protein